jgi:hypothetical protein
VAVKLLFSQLPAVLGPSNNPATIVNVSPAAIVSDIETDDIVGANESLDVITPPKMVNVEPTRHVTSNDVIVIVVVVDQ